MPMHSAMERIRFQQEAEQAFASKPCSEQKPTARLNPFKEHKNSFATTNFDGGMLYGVNERDNWLLAKDDASELQRDPASSRHAY